MKFTLIFFIIGVLSSLIDCDDRIINRIYLYNKKTRFIFASSKQEKT